MKQDEKILVVKREALFQGAVVDGFKPTTNFMSYQETIQHHKEFMFRSLAEKDINYKQIIPYVVFIYDKKVFVMQRKNDASEAQLRNKLTIGIGGHIRQEDIENQSIQNWVTREFHEEVSYNGAINYTPLGIINDESNHVGMVHTGLAFILQGDTDDITIKSELKNGSLMTKEACLKLKDSFESWSKLVLDELITNNII